jgi:hypothetical protein
MKFISRRPLGAIFLSATAALAISTPDPAQAQEGPGLIARTMGQGHWRLAASPFSHHFRYSEEHRRVWAVGGEWQRSDDWLAGASYFSNSFGQPSAYLYVGKRWPKLFGQEQLFAQASGGLLYGYRGKYEDKVPLNNNGFSPGALVGLGWQFTKNFSVTAHMLGDAGVMFQLAYDLR